MKKSGEREKNKSYKTIITVLAVILAVVLVFAGVNFLYNQSKSDSWLGDKLKDSGVFSDSVSLSPSPCDGVVCRCDQVCKKKSCVWDGIHRYCEGVPEGYCISVRGVCKCGSQTSAPPVTGTNKCCLTASGFGVVIPSYESCCSGSVVADGYDPDKEVCCNGVVKTKPSTC